MRLVLLVIAGLLVVVLGAVQVTSMAAYGDLAEPYTLPALLHSHGGRLPLLGSARDRAAAAVHAGDRTTATRLLATLPNDSFTNDLRGQLAAQSGREDEALDYFVRAGDGVRAQVLLDHLFAQARAAAPGAQRRSLLMRCLAYQTKLVDELSADPLALDTLGGALLRLGEIEREAGADDPQRKNDLYAKAERDYLRALDSAPNDATYLLRAGNQELLNAMAFGHGTGRAGELFGRVLEVAPNSPEAYAGLALAAGIDHRCADARQWLQRWKSTGARVRPPDADPELGAPLRACEQAGNR